MSCLDDFLALDGFLVEVDLWDGLDHFAVFQLVLPLLDICIGSWMLRDWLAVAFHCTVLLLVLRLVSVVVLWFALPAVGYALFLPAVGYALVLPAVGFALLAPDAGVLLAVLVLLLLYFVLLTSGSLAVV